MKIFFLGALALCLIAGTIGGPQTSEPFLLKPLDHGAWAAIDNPAAKADESGANAGFVVGSDAVLVVDTFENPAAAQKLLAVIHQKTTVPVRFVANTHYHLDHVAGNGVFAAAGATVLAQQNVRRWERTENMKFFDDKITAEQRSSVEALRLPDVTYTQGVTLSSAEVARCCYAPSPVIPAAIPSSMIRNPTLSSAATSSGIARCPI